MGLLQRLLRGAGRGAEKTALALGGAGDEIGQMYRSGYINPVGNAFTGGLAGAAYGAATGEDPLMSALAGAAGGGIGGTAVQMARPAMRGAAAGLRQAADDMPMQGAGPMMGGMADEGAAMTAKMEEVLRLKQMGLPNSSIARIVFGGGVRPEIVDVFVESARRKGLGGL